MNSVRELTELAAQEERLLEVVRAIKGSFEQRAAELARSGVFSEYRDVFARYLRLAAEDPPNVEALKRALFLVWYSHAEPLAFTGLRLDPSERSMQAMRGSLERVYVAEPREHELAWMIPYYYEIADFAFAGIQGSAALQSWLNTAASVPTNSARDEQRFAGRGQMGTYWISVSRSGR